MPRTLTVTWVSNLRRVILPDQRPSVLCKITGENATVKTSNQRLSRCLVVAASCPENMVQPIENNRHPGAIIRFRPKEAPHRQRGIDIQGKSPINGWLNESISEGIGICRGSHRR